LQDYYHLLVNIPYTQEARNFLVAGFLHIIPGGDLLSHTATRAVSSALRGLTSVFEMGTGVTPSALPPRNSFDFGFWSSAALPSSHFAQRNAATPRNLLLGCLAYDTNYCVDIVLIALWS
jgi:hypothetical protein